MTNAQMWEFILLALCVWREARNQSLEGKLAVAWSVRNRVKAPGQNWWGETWEQVILKRWQYTSFEKTDPNACLLPGDPATDIAWKDSLSAADLAYHGVGNDPSKGSTHYFNPAVVAPPAWAGAPGSQFIVKIGDHEFWKAA